MIALENFDIANDLKVEFLVAGGGTNEFIIGVSRIGGIDVLSETNWFTIGLSLIGGDDPLGGETFGFRWTDLSCSVSKASWGIGGKVQDQLYFQPQPGDARFTLQTFEFDPSYSPSMRPGIKCRLRLVKTGFNQILWSGVVDSVSVTYDVHGNNLISITAFDSLKRVLNTRLPLFDSETDFPGYVTPYEQLELIADALGTSMNSLSEATDGEIPSVVLTDVIPNDLVSEAIQVGLGLFWVDPATEEFVFVPRSTSTQPTAGTPIIGNHHDDPNHLCLTNLQTVSSDSTLFNSLKVSLESDTAISTLVEDIDSIELYGKYAKDVTINTTDLAELNRWAKSVFVQKPSQLVRSVDTNTKDRKGNLTQAAILTPGQKLGVHYTENIVSIYDFYTISRVSHSVDVDNWFTTLELWKEA
jgi:hypothetical protein